MSHRLLLSTPLGVFSYLLLWFVPRGWTSPAASVLWFLMVTCLFESLMSVSQHVTKQQFTADILHLMIFNMRRCYCSCSWSLWSCLLVSVPGRQCYNVPYLSLNMFLGGDHRDRDSATAYSESVATPDPCCPGGEGGRVSHSGSVSPLSQSSFVSGRDDGGDGGDARGVCHSGSSCGRVQRRKARSLPSASGATSP